MGFYCVLCLFKNEHLKFYIGINYEVTSIVGRESELAMSPIDSGNQNSGTHGTVLPSFQKDMRSFGQW